MPYLSGADNAFEKAINRGWTSARSAQLDETVEAIKQYIKMPTPQGLRAVYFAYDTWRSANPKEFRDRGGPLAADFRKELIAEYRKQGITVGEDSDPAEGPQMMPAPQVAINRWTTYKRVAKTGMTVASAGISGAQQGLGTGMTAMALGGAAAVSATGIGLVAAGGALTIGTTVLAIKSAWKTKKHKDALVAIYNQRDASPFDDPANCQVISDGRPVPKSRVEIVQHDMVANLVLPYIISKKDRKINHKIATAVPIVGSTGESARAIGKKAWKFAKGTLGVHRQEAAAWVASHLITCDCLLVQAIVAELYSPSEMEWLKGQPYGSVIELLENKMKST